MPRLPAQKVFLNRLSAELSTNPNDVDTNDALLRREQSQLPKSIANILLLSNDGRNIGNAVGRHASAGDRDYFKRATAGDQLVVEAPIRSRSDVGWVIPVASELISANVLPVGNPASAAAMESAAKASPVYFFNRFRRRPGKTRNDHVEVIEMNHSVADTGLSRRQFESAHPLQTHRVKINAGARFHVEAAEFELVTNFDVITRSIAHVPRRAECRSQPAQRE
jgi:hypothetical protein